jgi:hypothetical protein
MAEWLASAKMSYACSTHLLDHVDGINLTSEQRQLLVSIPDPMFRETLRDFMVNQQFRRDYWVKGAERLPQAETNEMLGKMRFVMVQHRPDVSLKINGALGEGTMNEGVYTPLLDLMADHKPRSLAQMEQALKSPAINAAQLKEAVIILAGNGTLALVQDDHVVTKARKGTSALNQYLTGRARGGGDFVYLASPVSGGGHMVGRFQQLFLQAIRDGRKQPADWAQAVWETLQQQGQKIMKDGKPLSDDSDNIAELNAQAATFAEKNLPVLKALQIA